MRALITRPAEDANEIADALRARGIEVVIEPMLEIVPVAAPPADLADVQALLFTSANGVRAFARLAPRRDITAFAVGDATAKAARAAGFTNVHSAGGDTHDLVRLVRARLPPGGGALLHVAGSAVAGNLAAALGQAGFQVRRTVLYDARPATALTPATVQRLRRREIDLVLFFSPRTARAFVSLVRGAGLDASLDRATAICLSHAVAAALDGIPFGGVKVAARPEMQALLAAVGTEAPGGDVTDKPTPRGRIRGFPPLTGWIVALILLLVATLPYWRAALPPAWQERIAAYLPGADSDRTAALEAEIAQLKAVGAQREGALGALIFALNRRVDQVEQARQAQPQGPLAPDPALTARLEALERAVDALKSAPPAPAQAAIDPAELRALADRVAALEARPQPESAASNPDFLRLAGRLALLETAVADAARRRAEPRQPPAAAFVLAVSQLREALRHAGPYKAELEAASAIAGDDAQAGEILRTLAPRASRGIPARDALAARFDSVAQDIVRAAQAPASDRLADRALSRVSELITVRRTGETDAATPEGIVARAESRIKAGDLAGAVDVLAALEGKPAAAAAEWLEDARARLAADQAAGRLMSLAIARLGAQAQPRPAAE